MRVIAWVAVLLSAPLLSAAPAAAEIVLLTAGSWLKVTGYRVQDDDRMRLELRGGGVLVMPLDRIDRIIDDEVVHETEVIEPPEATVLALRFDAELPPPAVPYGELIYEVAARHDLNPHLVAAVVRTESAFRATAVSHKGARGLMQLMPATAQRFGVQNEEAFEPARNLEAGSRYLRWLLDRFDDDLDLALAGYNAGEGSVDRYGGVPPYRETRNYIVKVYEALGFETDDG